MAQAVPLYSFPNVSIRENIVGPLPFQPRFRNTIGVAGVFSRGPVGVRTIRNRQDFAYIYGEDGSPGSVFVQQAMRMGATNFAISRVLPPAKAASLSVTVGTSINQEVAVGPAGDPDRLQGLVASLIYVGDPLARKGEFLGANLSKTAISNKIGAGQPYATVDLYNLNPNYQGDSTLIFRCLGVNEVVPGEIFTTAAAAPGGTFYASIPAVSAGGVVLAEINSSIGGIRSVAPGNTLHIEFGAAEYDYRALSYAVRLNNGNFGVLVSALSGSEALVVVNDACTIDILLGQAGYVFGISAESNVSSNLVAVLPGQALYKPAAAPVNLETDSAIAVPTLGAYVGYLVLPKEGALGLHAPLYTGYSPTATVYSGVFLDIQPLPNADGQVYFVPGSEFEVRYIKGEVGVGRTYLNSNAQPIEASIPGSDVLSLLRRAILSDPVTTNMVNEIEPLADQLPATINLKASFEGSNSNYVHLRIRAFATNPATPIVPDEFPINVSGVNVSATSYFLPFIGGKDAPRQAGRIFYDAAGRPVLLVRALSPGVDGNSIAVSIRPNPPGKFRLEVYDKSEKIFNVAFPAEAYLLDNSQVDVATGRYVNLIDSKLIEAFFIPSLLAPNQFLPANVLARTPQRLAVPFEDAEPQSPMFPGNVGFSYLREVKLQDGFDGANYELEGPTNLDYEAALELLKGADIAFVSVPGVTVQDSRYDSVVAALSSQVEQATVTNGLRMAAIAAPSGLTISRITSGVNPVSSERVVTVAGWSSFNMAGRNFISDATGYYLGKLAATMPHHSPASLLDAGPINGVVAVDTSFDPDYLEAVTQERMEAIYFDTASGVFKFLNGRTSSIDPNRTYVSVRRTMDMIITDLYANLQWVKSRPHTPAMRAMAADACNAYLRERLREEMIFGYNPTICNESNNSISDMRSGRINITISVIPVYPSDYVIVNVIRDIRAEITLATSLNN